MLFNLLVVLALILANGLLAMSELAVVSARKARLQGMQRRAVRGARTALDLHGHPGRFLSTVQIGITLVGVFAGAFSGATLAEPLADWFAVRGWNARYADDLALGVVVAGVTYLSLIVGELVPKQIALRNPERIACIVAPPLLLLSRLARPLVWLLDVSSALVLRLMPARQAEPRVTDEEIHALMAEAASSGIVEPEEKAMIASVMRLADRSVRALMTPRQQLDWIDLDDPLDVQLATLRESRHSKLIAARGQIDHFSGIVAVKRIIDAVLDGADRIVPVSYVEDALVLQDTIDALDAIPVLKRNPLHTAIVVDEFGSLQGMITVTDVLSAIAGEFQISEDDDQPAMIPRADGSWLVDGDLPADSFAERLQIELPRERDYETVAGLVLALLGHLPKTGETLGYENWQIEVVDLDGRRIDKLLVRPLDDTGSAAAQA
jgi:putative hemolysin